MFENNVFRNPLGWARTLVGGRSRFLATCAIWICTGALSLVGVRLLLRVVELRIELGPEIGPSILPLERGVFAIVFLLVVYQTVTMIMMLVALRRLLA